MSRASVCRRKRREGRWSPPFPASGRLRLFRLSPNDRGAVPGAWGSIPGAGPGTASATPGSGPTSPVFCTLQTRLRRTNRHQPVFATEQLLRRLVPAQRLVKTRVLLGLPDQAVFRAVRAASDRLDLHPDRPSQPAWTSALAELRAGILTVLPHLSG